MKAITLYPPLTASQKIVGTRLLLINSFMMVFGYISLITVVSLHFTHDLLFTTAAVGIALALRSMTQQGLDLFGGIFADRFGYRFSITIGCMIRVTAFVGMGMAHTFQQLLIACFVVGFGGMFFDAAGAGALAALVPQQRRARIFALQATLCNIGAALGPIIGIGVYARFGFTPVALLAAVVFLCIGIQTFIWLPKGVGHTVGIGDSMPLTFKQTLRAIMLRRNYVRVVLLLMGFWLINAQIMLTVPLAGAHLFGKNGVAILLSLNSFLAIPLQYPFVRWLEKYLAPVRLLALSTILCGLGLTVVFLAPNFGWQIAGIVIATFGCLAVVPTMATITAQVAPPSALAAFYGFSALSIGFGGALGQYFGGRIYDLQNELHLSWLLAVFMILVAFGIAIALFRSPSPTVMPHLAANVFADEDVSAQSGVIAVR